MNKYVVTDKNGCSVEFYNKDNLRKAVSDLIRRNETFSIKIISLQK